MTHPTDADKLSCVLKLAFDNNRLRYDRFCEIVRKTVPEAHAAVLRGSAITGTRYVDGAPFDADGPGTSDLDLTLVGADVLRYYSAFFSSMPWPSKSWMFDLLKNGATIEVYRWLSSRALAIMRFITFGPCSWR